MTIARLLCALVVAATVTGCSTDIGRTQARGTLGAVTVGGLLGSKIEGSNDQLATAAVDVAYGEVAQFALPKPAPEGKVPAVQLPKELTFEYVYGSELEAPYVNNADLDDNLTDDSLILAPTLFAGVTYRPTDWLETRMEATLEKLVAVHDHKFVTLPDGSIQKADPRPWSLLIDQIYAKAKLPKAPVEFTVGRQIFEDARLWLFDGELDAVRVALKPGDFKIEASLSREDLLDLDLLSDVKFIKGRIDNYALFAEYRGIEDHKLVGYWILRDDKSDEEGQPQFMGVRAYGRPADEFRYWADLGFVRGEDEFSQDLSGTAFEVGGTYWFLDLPLQPSITLGYAYGSGDGNPDDSKNHEFRQTGLQSNETRFGGVTQFLAYGETLDPELSNLNIFTAGLGLRPAAGVFIDIVYHHYRLNEFATEVRGSAITAQMNQIDSQLSKDVGDALDIVLGFRNLFGVRGLGFEVRGGWFFPGDAFRRDEGGVIKDADKGVSALVVIFY